MTGKEYYKVWEEAQKKRGIDLNWVKEQLKTIEIDTPSWGYNDAGTRFQVFKDKGIPRNIYERLDDAAEVNKLTGVAPGVALHIPWDKPDDGDYKKLRKYAENLGLKLTSVQPNLFQDYDYKYSSLCNSNPVVRRKAIDQCLESIEICKTIGAKALSLWLPDGTNHPGQGDFRDRKHWLEDALVELYGALDSDMILLLEYKLFEPFNYHTDIAEWGISYVLANKLGDKAKVLVDLGHHALNINIQNVVAILLDEGKIGGFHFNSKKYADDDLIVGSANPYELYLIFNELVAGMIDKSTQECIKSIDYMIDENHSVEPKIPAMIRAILNVQTAHAKALLVNRKALKQFQDDNDVLAAENEVRGAFEIDVKPLLEAVREEMGLAPDPMKAYLDSDYQAKKVAERI
jgi:L-rhamnose isomerase/sugar isomerase